MSTSEFTPEHFNELAEDPYYRFMYNSKKVGYAIISDINNEVTQFTLGAGTTPVMRPLNNIRSEKKYGKTIYRATTPNNTSMTGKRFMPISFEQDGTKYNAKIVCFSPTDKKDFVGSDTEIKLRTKKTNPKMVDRIKGGAYMTIKADDVTIRADQSRPKSQNQVMGRSARDEYEQYQDMYEDALTAPANAHLKKASEAELRHRFYSQKRPEWLHAYSFTLTPLALNPQVSQNLGSAPKWANTAMMIPERAARWFTLNHPQTTVKIKPTFEMIKDFEIIRKIKYELLLIKGNRRLRFLQCILPFARFPLYNKSSDIAGATFLAAALMNQKTPSQISSLALTAAQTTTAAPKAKKRKRGDDSQQAGPSTDALAIAVASSRVQPPRQARLKPQTTFMQNVASKLLPSQNLGFGKSA